MRTLNIKRHRAAPVMGGPAVLGWPIYLGGRVAAPPGRV